jgi:hypothetical protein
MSTGARNVAEYRQPATRQSTPFDEMKEKQILQGMIAGFWALPVDWHRRRRGAPGPARVCMPSALTALRCLGRYYDEGLATA